MTNACKNTTRNKGTKNNLTKRLAFRLTNEEYILIDRLAYGNDQTISDCIRKLISNATANAETEK